MGKNVGGNLTLNKTIDFKKIKIYLYNYSITGLYCEKEYINGVANIKN